MFHVKLDLATIKSLSFHVYSNPSDGNFIVEFENDIQSERVLIELLDAEGRSLAKELTKPVRSSFQFIFNSNRKLIPGTYTVRISDANYITTKKIIIN